MAREKCQKNPLSFWWFLLIILVVLAIGYASIKIKTNANNYTQVS